jgi:CheY-like chemotaxis protein
LTESTVLNLIRNASIRTYSALVEAGCTLGLSAVLEQAGYAVDVAEDGFVALRKIQQTTPDLVITDLRMPNMNGFELLSVIRSRSPELPAIAISGEFLAVDVQEGMLADAFFQKGNYSLADFLGKISQLLSSPRKSTKQPPAKAPVWAPTGDAPVMLTCTKCLHSFPIEACEEATVPRQTDCIFCGTHLEIQLVAVGMAAN